MLECSQLESVCGFLVRHRDEYVCDSKHLACTLSSLHFCIFYLLFHHDELISL
jgi:hypothetical protein